MKDIRTMKHTTKCSALLATAMALPSFAWAACDGGTVTRNMPFAGTVIVKQNGAVGEVLRGAPVSDNAFVALCSPNQEATFSGRWVLPAGWSVSNDVLQTNLAGLGITVHISDSNITGAERTGIFNNKRTIAPDEGVDAAIYRGIYDQSTYTIRLVRTAPSLAFGPVTLGNFYEMFTDGDTMRQIRRMYINGLTLTAASCSVRAGDLNQTIALGTHAAGTLVRDGHSPWVDFSITSEDCDTSQMADARYTFTAPGAQGDAGLFDARQAGSGQSMGLGVQIEAVPAGGAVAVTPNQPVVVPSLPGGDAYAFRARLKTVGGATPRPGMIHTPIQVNVDFM